MLTMDLRDIFPYYLDGVDKTGRTVLTIPFGSWDIKGFVDSDEQADKKFASFTSTFVEDIISRLGRRPQENDGPEECNNEKESSRRFIVIADMKGYSYGQITSIKAVQCMIHLVKEYEQNVAASMDLCMVINAPGIFSVFLKIVKPFMSGRTLEKIKTYSDKTRWQQLVLEQIDPSQIRKEFGGAK